MSKPELRRYTDQQRLNHWFFALGFLAAGLSGLALFHPSFYFLVNLFGGGSWTRILHPFIGAVTVLSFLFFALRLLGANMFSSEDRAWRKQMGTMMKGKKAQLPPTGRFNYGQKVVYWVMLLSMLVLAVTGVMFWRPWFDGNFSIELQRIAVVAHAIAAVVVILAVIVHIYAAIWVKGTTRAMTRGTVSDSWARLNHGLWRDQMLQQANAKGSKR